MNVVPNSSTPFLLPSSSYAEEEEQTNWKGSNSSYNSYPKEEYNNNSSKFLPTEPVSRRLPRMMGDSTPPKLKKILHPKTLLLLLSPPPPPKQEQQEEQQQPHRRREIRQRMPNILGSVMASCLAQILYLPGLLVLAALLLEISAELSNYKNNKTKLRQPRLLQPRRHRCCRRHCHHRDPWIPVFDEPCHWGV